MTQLIDSHTPSPNASVVSSASTATGTSYFASSIAPDDSVSQVSLSKPQPKALTPGLFTSGSGALSRDVSPAAPPLLSIPSSSNLSREVSPSVESGPTVDDLDDELAPGVDFKTLLQDIPRPWNVGPVSEPPALPKPLHLAKLKPEVALQVSFLKDKTKVKHASKEDKDKAKAAGRPHVSNFREQDQSHLKLNLEFMDDLVATVYAFPNEETCWNFALLSNYWASIRLGCSYQLNRDSEHCRLVCLCSN